MQVHRWNKVPAERQVSGQYNRFLAGLLMTLKESIFLKPTPVMMEHQELHQIEVAVATVPKGVKTLPYIRMVFLDILVPYARLLPH